MPEAIVGREAERALLRRQLETPGAKVVLVSGRRRVGKTYLLAHTWAAEHTFHFTATRTTAEQNRRQLIDDLAAWTGAELDPGDYPSWRTVFDLLWRTRERAPQVVILDEFQEFAVPGEGLAGVASAINATLERTPLQRPFVLVLSGSSVRTLEALASGGAPLYGRLAAHVRLGPLPPFDTASFVPSWTARQRAAAHGALGGTPAYWSLVDPRRDLRTALVEHVLTPTGRARLMLETTLDQEEGLGDVSAYRAIVRAVARGATTRPRIADASGLKLDHALVRRLGLLVELGLLEEVRVIEAPRNAPVRYRVLDPALRFLEALVVPHTSLLERVAPEAVFDRVVAPRLDTFLGHAFERMVTPTYERLRLHRDLPLVQAWGHWQGADRDRRPVEIDVVAPLVDGGVLTGAVKWNTAPLGVETFYAHLDAVQRAADAGQRWAHAGRSSPMLFLAAGGFDDRFLTTAEAHPARVLTWTVDDVYAPR